jgi:type IV pilus assembly protein PilW
MKKNGFTLIEVVVATAISSIVMAGIFSVYWAQSKSHRQQQQIVERQQNLRAVSFLMERDIRLAGFDPTEDDIAGIIDAKVDTIEFTMNIIGGETDGIDNDFDGAVDEDTAGQESDGIDNDGDGTTDEPDEADESGYSDNLISGAGETIKYRLVGTSLIRNAGYGDQIASDNINSIQFDYLDASGASLIDTDLTPNRVPATDLDLIRRVEIILTVQDDDGTLTYKNEVRCRNLNFD